jgi:hypothetical protein
MFKLETLSVMMYRLRQIVPLDLACGSGANTSPITAPFFLNAPDQAAEYMLLCFALLISPAQSIIGEYRLARAD